MASFATPTELETYIGLGTGTINVGRAQVLLNQVSEIIRGYVEQNIDAVAGDVYGLDAVPSPTLVLPERPVTAVSQITVDGGVQPASSYVWRPSGIIRRLAGAWWSCVAPFGIKVTYDHGFATIPDDIKGVCLAVASRAYTFTGGESLGFGSTKGDAGTLSGLVEGRGFAPDLVLFPTEKQTLGRYKTPVPIV